MENNDVQHLEKLRAYWDEHQAFPSMAKLREVVAMGSTASVFEMISRLVEAGQLKRVEGRIAPTRAFLARPVECAEPAQPDASRATKGPATLNVLDYVMPDPGRSFFVTVPDEQLAAKDIRQGDLLVMQEDAHAQSGDIVVTRHGDKVLFSLLSSIKGRKLVLEPAFYDLQCGTGLREGVSRTDIAGVAIAMVRRFDRAPSKKANG